MVGRIERGDRARIAWADLVRVAEAVGARLDFDLRWQGEAIDRLLDDRHAATVDAAVRLLRAAGWDVEIEVSVSIREILDRDQPNRAASWAWVS